MKLVSRTQRILAILLGITVVILLVAQMMHDGYRLVPQKGKTKQSIIK